jgi:glycosyltransferase involved in cell wall biosynthesis
MNSKNHAAIAPFSVFIPVYNEEDIMVSNTEKLISYLGRFGAAFEIIIGSNGSDDKTPKLGEMLAGKYSRIRFFHMDEKGPGEAFRYGVEIARYNNIVSLDMDLSIELDFIDKALTLLDSGYDIIIGSKKMGQEKRSFARKLGSDLFVLTARALMDISFVDYSIGAKAYKRNLLMDYLHKIDHGTAYVLTLVYLAHKRGKRVIEVPVLCEDYRGSKFNIIYEGLYRFAQLFKAWCAAQLGRL